MVVGPNVDIACVRSTQLVDLSSHVVMVVAVMSNGVIEKAHHRGRHRTHTEDC